MDPSLWIPIAAGIVAWCLFWVWLVPLARTRIEARLADRIGTTPFAGAVDLLIGIYCRLLHRVRFVGFDDLPAPFRHGDAGGGLVVANHTAGIDPLLVQTGIRRFIRWMMWADMMTPSLDAIWKAGQILPVSYGNEDSTTVRLAIRHVRDGGLVGVFAEGGIAKPPGSIHPFQAGVGLLARMTKAPILLVHIHGTPNAPDAFASVFRPSHATVEVVGIFDLSREKDPHRAVEILRNALIEHTGWPSSDVDLVEKWRAELAAATGSESQDSRAEPDAGAVQSEHA